MAKTLRKEKHVIDENLVIRNIEKEIQDAIKSSNLDRVLDSIDMLGIVGLKYRDVRYCIETVNVAKYDSEKNELRTFLSDIEVNEQLFQRGLKEISSTETFYKYGVTCARYSKKRYREGLISKVSFEGWTDEESVELDKLLSLNLVTDVDFYVWGQEWGEEGDTPYEKCFEKRLKIPKEKVIIKVSLSKVLERVKHNTFS